MARPWKKSILSATSLSLAFLVLLAHVPAPALARRSPPPSYWRGPVYRTPPRDHHVVRHRGDRFYYTGGRFYRRAPGRLVLVPPPFGAVVPVLPYGYVTLVIGGLTYYQWNGIYYREVPQGYTVVDPPAGEAPPESSAPAAKPTGQVIVQSELLNVRSGPGLDQDIITQLTRGTGVDVMGSIPEWLYIEMSDGERGWVMEKFVVPVKPVPEG